MGGDYAPETSVGGAVLALNELSPEVRLVLIGIGDKIVELLKKYGVSEDKFDIVNATGVIEMADQPMKAINQKPNSSIAIGFNLLKHGKIDAFASNGNTGAMLVGALYSVKTVKGVQRPCIAAMVPMENGKTGILLDIGSNADCRPEMLCQFALLGQIYMQHVLGIPHPRVALLNIGEEDEKGNIVTQATFQLLKEMPQVHFVGNLEARDLFDSRADVIVCEGFVGNVVLKEAEAFYKLLKKKGISDPFFDRINYEIYGGTPILGVNSTVIIGHGISNEVATKNMLLLAKDMVEREVTEKIKKAFNT